MLTLLKSELQLYKAHFSSNKKFFFLFKNSKNRLRNENRIHLSVLVLFTREKSHKFKQVGVFYTVR